METKTREPRIALDAVAEMADSTNRYDEASALALVALADAAERIADALERIATTVICDQEHPDECRVMTGTWR